MLNKLASKSHIFFTKSAACSKHKRAESDPIHSSMNQEHSQQDPQNFFNEERVSDRQHPELILGAEHVTHSWVLFSNGKMLFEIHLCLLVLPENCALTHFLKINILDLMERSVLSLPVPKNSNYALLSY